MHFGLENHPSTYRGAILLAAALFAWFDRCHAFQYFEAGLTASGLIGLATKEGAK